MAALSAGMPVTAVYFEHPSSIARFAASRTACGGSKSGSPTPKANTSTPRAFISSAREFMASVTLGATALSRDASCRATVEHPLARATRPRAMRSSQERSSLLGRRRFGVGLLDRPVAVRRELLVAVHFIRFLQPL